MHHGRLPRRGGSRHNQLASCNRPTPRLRQPLIKDTEMDNDDPPSDVDQPATSFDPAPHPEPVAPRSPRPDRDLLPASSGHPRPTHQPRRPAWPSSRPKPIASVASRAGPSPCNSRR
eukprot:jgi/Tetstr1/456753/TSEL_043450.t1